MACRTPGVTGWGRDPTARQARTKLGLLPTLYQDGFRCVLRKQLRSPVEGVL